MDTQIRFVSVDRVFGRMLSMHVTDPTWFRIRVGYVIVGCDALAKGLFVTRLLTVYSYVKLSKSNVQTFNFVNPFPCDMQ